MKTKIELIITLFLISALIPILFLSRCNAQDFDAEVREQHLNLVDQDFYQTDIHYPNLLILRKPLS